MVDVILSSDNVTVLGGPSRLEVDLNIGAPGTRGSLFFVGTQNPNTLNPTQDFPSLPIIFDIFINVNASSSDYLQAYQYVNRDGINSWIPTFSINQNIYSVNKVLEFVNGQATALVNIIDLGIDALPFENDSTNNPIANSFTYFNVQATVSNINLGNISATALPCSFSVKVGNAYFDNAGSSDPSEIPFYVPVTFNAVEFNGTAWSPINNKTTIAYLTVSFASPNEILSVISQNSGGGS